MKIATPCTEKSNPFLSQQPPLKVEVLPSPPFFKIWLEAQTPCRKVGGRGGCTLCYLKIVLRIIVQWEFLDSLLWYRCYIQAIIVFHWICLELTQLASLYYFNRIYKMWFLPHLLSHHDLFSFQKFCTCVDDTFLVPVRFICISISRFISLIFISIPVAWNISSLDHCFLILKILCP